MKTHDTNRRIRPLVSAVALALAGAALSAGAAEYRIDEVTKVRVGGTVSIGTAIRTQAPDPDVLGTLSTARVGLPPGNLGGNSGGSDLNFTKGDPVSTVVKGTLELEVTRENFGAFLRGRAWYDYELEKGDRPYGNFGNGFRAGAPLSDDGWQRAAKFSGAEFAEAYAWGRFDAGTAKLDVRVGRQVVTWGVSQMVLGGVNTVNPLNLAGQLRPGALPEEARVPVGMVYANLAAGRNWGVDAHVKYEFRPGVQHGCGTFYAQPNFSPQGCNFVNILGGQGLDDPTALATNRYVKRAEDDPAKDGGQWGLAGSYLFESIETEVRAYAANYHAALAQIRVVNPLINGGYGTLATRLTDPNGLKYQMANPEDIRMYGASFETGLRRGTRIYGEVSYRPDQPLGINASDLIAAFYTRSPLAALNLYRGTAAIPPGGTFDGWDRKGVSMSSLGGSQVFPSALGAERVTLTAEAGYSRINDLPDPGTIRYGRSEDYGNAQVTGGAPCVDNTASKKTCALDGFFTTNAWGYRLRVGARYPNAVLGATLTPVLLFAHDVKGYSYGGFFVEGRKLLRPTLRAEWGRNVYAELQYTAFSGGRYFTQPDRDLFVANVGYRF